MNKNAIEKRNKILKILLIKKLQKIKKLTEQNATDFNKMKKYYGNFN